nr:globin domain-containing protein [Rhodovulum sp. P5]
MDPQYTSIVVDSAKRLFSSKGRMADHFYTRLFEIAPESRALFGNDMAKQKKVFSGALAMLIGQIGDRNRLKTSVGYVARMHAKKGVTPEYLAIGGQAFHQAVCDFYGDACTEDLQRAWAAAYDEIVEIMLATGFLEDDAPAI